MLAPHDYLPVEPDTRGSDGQRVSSVTLRQLPWEVEQKEVVDHDDVMVRAQGPGLRGGCRPRPCNGSANGRCCETAAARDRGSAHALHRAVGGPS